MEFIKFTNMQPSAFDNLGAITWEAPMVCVTHGELTRDNIILRPYYYDGYNWENPHCKLCDVGITGWPVNNEERKIFFARRPQNEEQYNKYLAPTPDEIKLAENNKNISTAEIKQDIADTEAEIANMTREATGLEMHGGKMEVYRAQARRDGIKTREKFVKDLKSILKVRGA